ncbi:MSHA biogenesis protein MshQ [Pseudomonas fluvialis]|uniref:MSHA biogenesis protein MshQ n=1 Tax=Pseudomonas fluvialis TaxID=1793966 RepID=A0A7X0EVB5_9PSED|nr:DUF6701 domain-containing protein [Pseudomonas fluvialis]MBB6342650.1 MSHA biogenesis protein MshQ [Pseudomonas fluvialis]
MRVFGLFLLMLLSPWAQALVGNCPSNFPDGLQTPYIGNAAQKGGIVFDYNAQLLGNPDSVLAAKTVNRNAGSTLLTCSGAHCTASGIAAPIQDPGSFPDTSAYTATVNVPYASTQTLAGNGVNQYRSITLNDSAQLTVNGSSQTFFIDQLNLASSSTLRLSPGDYWVRALTTGYQSQIQVQGSGQVRLFVRDNWTLASSALLNSPAINTAGSANNLYLFSYGSLTLNNQATLSGYVYSANQQGANQAVTLDSPSYVFGALSGENISLASNARVTYVAPSGNCGVVTSQYWWALDEAQWTGATGEVLESTGTGLAGRGLGGAQTANATPALSGSPGTCGYGVMTGGSSRVEIADNNGVDFNTQLSMGLWIRPTQTPSSTVVILRKGTNYQLALDSSRRLVLTTRFSYGLFGGGETLTVTSSSALPLNTWSHVGFSLDFFEEFLVADYITGRIFINGVQSASGQSSAQLFGATTPNSSVLQIGGTGSTGFTGWLDEVRLDQQLLVASDFAAQMAYRHACPTVAAVDHYELVYASSQALTCNPLDVTVRACQNSSCSSLYASPVTVNLTPSGTPNNWSATPVTFTGSSALQFQRTTAGTSTLGLTATPAASNATQCIVGGVSASCAVTFASSGFILNVPNILANKPTAATLQAVKDDGTQTCVPAWQGDRTVNFTRTYSNPASGTLPVQINGATVTSNTPLTLSFDSTASAALTVRYADAGLISLGASYSGSSGLDAGLVLTGNDDFVSKPYGLLLQTDTAAGCTAADISCPLYPGGVRAGDSFSLRIKAVAWQSDGEALTAAALADNSVTPNFQLNGIALASQVQAPVGGSNGALGVSSYNHGLGAQTALSNQSISEVGVFRIAATPPANAYFGETVSATVSGLVGRFAPAFLQASGEAALTPSCGTAFSYQGQPMAFASGQDPRLTVTAFNRQNVVTGNYDRGDFWRLSLPGRDDYLSVTGKASLDTPGRLQAQGTLTTSQSGADGGDGARTWRWSGEQLLYTPATVPLADDLPFNAAIRQGFSASALTDADGACVRSGSTCQTYSYDFSGSQVRLGRLSIGNAHGSELQPLALPLRLESWQGSSTGLFQLESADTCTAAVLGQPELGVTTGNLSAGDTTASLSSPALTAAQGLISLTAPGAGNDGSVLVGLRTPTACIAGQANCLPDWLWYDWRGNGREAPQGLATFGVYRGAAPLIYRRELYR